MRSTRPVANTLLRQNPDFREPCAKAPPLRMSNSAILHQLTATMLLSFHFAKHWEANRGAIDPLSPLCIQPKFVAPKLLRRLRLRLP